MSFVLQLGTVGTTTAAEKTKSTMQQQPSSKLLAQELADASDANDSSLVSTDEIDSPRSSQVIQCLESSDSSELVATHALPLKSVSVTYPVAKGTRDNIQRISGPQTITSTTTQVLTTRVISQKLPASGYQAQPLTLNASSHITNLSGKQQSRIQEAKQQPGTKLQPISPQQVVSGGVVKTITSGTSMPNIQRIHVKTQNIVGQQAQSVNLQKVKSVASVNSQQVTGGAVQRNSVARIQTVPKSQVVAAAATTTQFVNQLGNNGSNVQRNQGNNATVLQKAQSVNNSSTLAAVPQKGAAQIYNNQKVASQLLGSHPNHKAQQQQYPVNQQVPQQSLQKVQGQSQKGLTISRQQQPATVVNNVQKPNNSVAGIQKSQQVQHNQQHHQSPQFQKHVQQQAPQHPRSQSAVALPKGTSLATVNSARVQTITANVCKSNSVVPNVSKMQQNSNVIAVGKQQIVAQSQHIHIQGSQQPMQQQLLHQASPLQQQQSPVNQKANMANQQSPRSSSITNLQKVSAIAAVPNNQRTTGQLMNSKVQQQMVMRVGVPKNQGLQQINTKVTPTKIGNPVKAGNSPNSVQQAVHRNSNSQPIKIIQQQQQNIIGPQNAQKQPGCIKTIPPQKSGQRNHTQKVSGIKTSLNTNVAALKSQQGTGSSQIAQKASIKTLLPQQTVAPNVLLHKNQPIKIQQQAIQQKQLIMTSQFPQQVRQQSGQIKTLLPVTSNPEPRKGVESKSEPEPKEEERPQSPPKSPVRRMPLPYECLQFVLQDHNYGAPPPRTPPPPSPPPHPKQQPINGASSSTTTVQHPYIYGPVVSNTNVEDDAASAISSEAGREAEPEGEETETAPEGEGDDEDSVTRCICDFEHDDGYMICCDRCLVWQHVDCMGIDRSNIPDEYLCEICRPRRVDRQRARALQMRKREELLNSDTSSETSSTSSADTDVGVNAVPKKRPLQQQQQPQQQQQQQQQQQVPRRKSDPPPQVRRLNNNNNNNVAKRQRRDSHPRQSSAVRKKEVVKRGPGKRKTKRRMSVDDKEEEVQDTWGSSNVAPLRQWIERYEEAVTNHYSPELRARISSIKVNGTHSDLRQSNMNVIATGKCRLNVHSNNLRFLVATMYLPPNTPVVELRGKYMLSTQHRPSHPQGRQHSQRPGPFVFFYRLPRDGTEVCVDTRTYGNDARFVRRSCKPNAEVKHCIEKGTLHLYIVTTTAIEKNAEITIRHDQHDLLLSPNPNCPISPVVCACNNPRECQITSVNQLSRRGSNGALAENADGRERRRRGRRNTVSEDSDAPAPVPTTSITQPTVTPTIVTVTPPPPPPPPPRRTVTPQATVATTTRQTPKEEPPTTVQQPETPPILPQPTPAETKKDKKKMTREERKMEAIMKAFERLEKAEQRKQEVQARNAQRKESGGTHSDNEEPHSTPVPPKQQKQQNPERPLRRKRRKGRARTTSTSQSTRRTRLNSADSDVSSGDESNSMQSPPLHSQTQTREAYNSHLHTPAKSENSATPGHQGIPTAAGLLLALANSNAPTPNSPPLQQPTPVKSPTCDSGASSSSQSSTPSTPLSSACLLVAAAVGPLAPGFKFPKTKKVLMNEWLKESPDPPVVNVPQVSPLPSLPSNPLQNSINPLCRSTDFSLPSNNDPSAEFLSQSYAAKSLATLVQAANSVSGICDSPPQRKQAVSVNSVCPVSSGSAKKRWLRQAISEECDSPNSRPESPPASEMVAPPKKRRIARENLSSDNYTPPTTPTMLVPEIVPNTRSICPNEEEFEHSPLAEQNGDRQFDSDSVKQELNVDSEPLDSDETNSKLPDTIHFEVLSCKTELKVESVKEEVALKDEKRESEDEEMEDSKAALKREDHCKTEDMDSTPVKREAKEEPVIEKGTVEIIDQNEQDTEMEDVNSSPIAMESDAILKERVAEMRLEFGGGIAEEVNVTSENERSDDDRKCESIKCHDTRSDDNMSIDEFDVEAQMKKITGDDGNDYKEKIDSSSEKDKSMDGIEGLMESSKEDSESDDKEMMEDFRESSFKIFDDTAEERSFKEFECKAEVVETMEEKPVIEESQKTEQPSDFVSEESVFESTSSNMDTESIADPPKIFQSIPPLSERIRKKADTSTTKSQLTFEAAIIESTITMEVSSMDESSKNGEEKSMLSTALRELLEAKLEETTTEETKHENNNQSNSVSPVESSKPTSTESSQDVPDAKPTQETHSETMSPKEEEAKEVKRLKDPRTVVPNSMPAPAFKPDVIPPVKRKLSISEYRKRKQQSSGTPPEPEQSNDASSADKNSARGRSDSASSGTSSLSSDEEGSKMSLNLDIPSLTTLPLFANAESEEKKGGEEGAIGWSAAPTLVERQRENLTERLKREFGLFLSDDEEERARKHGLTAEAILKARKTSPPQTQVSSTPPGYPLPQLPPQPYIPPPGSAIHYPQFPSKTCPVQYPGFPIQSGQTTQPVYGNTPPPPSPQGGGSGKQQFLVPQASPQAPPGSNPYPPQFIPPTNATAATVSKFSSVTPPAANQIYPGAPATPATPPPPAASTAQKPFFTHPAPRS